MGITGSRAGLDGLFLSQPNTGSGQYTLNLWRALATDDRTPSTTLLCPAGAPDGDAGGEVARVDILRGLSSAKAQKLWWEQRGVLRAARQAGVDLLHVPYFSAPRVARLPVVTTIHDVIPLLFPEYGGSTPMRLYLRLVTSAARRATMILTDSECSARDIERLLGISRERIRVIPLAVDDRFRPDPRPALEPELRARFGLQGPVIFNVGGLDVRKNLKVLIEAFARALPSLDPRTRLVIAGRAHTGNTQLYPPLAPVITDLGLEGKVVLTGAISEEQKLTFCQFADLYVFPSLYEGFGFPPLEAMACGTAVIAADRASVPEVVGDGGVLVEPTPEALAGAIVSVLTDDELRADLVGRGLEQAAHFSWARTAELTRDAYREVLGGAGRR